MLGPGPGPAPRLGPGAGPGPGPRPRLRPRPWPGFGPWSSSPLVERCEGDRGISSKERGGMPFQS